MGGRVKQGDVGSKKHIVVNGNWKTSNSEQAVRRMEKRREKQEEKNKVRMV